MRNYSFFYFGPDKREKLRCFAIINIHRERYMKVQPFIYLIEKKQT